MMNGPRTAPLFLTLSVVAISTAAPLVKMVPEVPALVVAAYRLVLASAVLAPLGWGQLRRQGVRFTRRDILIIGGAGGCLALHFASWITSLHYTSVASSVVLVTLSPVILALAGYALWGERLSRVQWLGIGLALVGSIGIAWHDVQGPAADAHSGRALYGDALALVGAVMASGYLLFGRIGRSRLPLNVYVGAVYTVAALAVSAACFGLALPTFGYDARAYVILVLIALIPQAVGHTILNWALAYLSPTLVALVILGEPVGASTLAWLALGEEVSVPQGVSGGLILVGIYLGHRQATQRSPLPDADEQHRSGDRDRREHDEPN